jgi:hypothetical protein
MSPVKSSSHAVYDLKYHFVWIPKYRKMILREAIAKRVDGIFRGVAEIYEFEIETMAVIVFLVSFRHAIQRKPIINPILTLELTSIPLRDSRCFGWNANRLIDSLARRGKKPFLLLKMSS